MNSEEMERETSSWWPHATDPDYTEAPQGWQWGAHPRFTQRYKHLLLDAFCQHQAQAMRDRMAESSFEEFFMSLAFDDDNGDDDGSDPTASVRQNALACTSFEESTPALQESGARALVEELSKPELRENRARLFENYAAKSSVFSSVDEDSTAEDQLYSLVCSSVGAVLEAQGFTADKLGLHSFLALAKAHVAGWRAPLEESITCLLHGGAGDSRFEFAAAPQGSSTSCGKVNLVNTLVIAFSSMGNGLVRPGEYGVQ
jgi:hypothetical protein